MYNYIRELHRIFNTEPNCPEQRKQSDDLQVELRTHLGEKERKLLLRLADTQSLLNYEISLESFAAGFRLATGIAKELGSDGLYSFDDEETARICKEPSDRKGV